MVTTFLGLIEFIYMREILRKIGVGKFLLRNVITPAQKLNDLRFPDRDVQVDVGDYKLSVFSPRKNRIGRSLYRDRIWEPAVTSCINTYTRSNMIALDVGADIGYYTVQFSRLVGPQGKVIAFEPIPEARNRLAHNISINQCSNILVSEYALGNQEGSVFLEDPLNKSRINLDKITPSDRDIKITIKRMDDLIREMGLESIDLVKIDVEGAEHEVLLGMEQALRRHRPILIVEVHNQFLPLFGSSSEKLLSWLSSLGYRITTLDEEPGSHDWFTRTVCCEAGD